MDLKDTLKRMHRSKTDKMLGGVCGGIGETTDTPAWVWRALVAFMIFWFGAGLGLYIILWIVMPEEPQVK